MEPIITLGLRVIRMAFISKNKMAFLLGTISVPDITNPYYSAWERCNTLIMSWLLNSISPSIAQSVIFLESDVDNWTDLHERFSQGDLLRIAELQEEIYGLSQANRSVSEFYTALKALWEELDNYRPPAACSCDAKIYHQQDFIIHFLKRLDERFSVVRSQILLMDPLPAVNRIFSMVIQHERQLHIPPTTADDPNSFVNAAGGPSSVKSRGGSRSQPNKTSSNKRCAYCHRSGHTINECWGKHGYPPGHPRYPGHPQFTNILSMIHLSTLIYL